MAAEDLSHFCIVDFSPCNLTKDIESFSAANLKEVSKQICDSLSKDGIVYLKNHGIAKSQFDRAWQKADAFFALDVEEKKEFRVEPKTFHGWMDTEYEQLNPEFKELKESINLTPKTSNRWPSQIPGFKEEMVKFMDMCQELTNRLLMMIAIGLGLEQDYFSKCHFCDDTSMQTQLKMLLYPVLSDFQDWPEKYTRFNEHKDFGSITLLFLDDTGGLQIGSKDNFYHPVPIIPGSVVVMVAELLERWTADKLFAPMHRVIEPDKDAKWKKPRRSAVFFAVPDDNVPINCIDESKYPPVTWKDFLKQRVDHYYTRP